MAEQRRDRNRRLILVAVAALAGATAIGYREWPGGDIGAKAAAPGRAHVDAAAAGQQSTEHPGGPAHERPAPRPLPPPGTPLAQTFDKLKARADAGDAAAASRLYHDLHRCHEMQRKQRNIERRAAALLDRDTRKLLPEELEDHDRMLQSLQEDLQEIHAYGDPCAGMTREQVDSLVPVTLRAAQLGDVKAIDCYVGSYFGAMPGLLDHPEWLADFRGNTAPLFDIAVHRGDWGAVELLHQAFGNFSYGTPGAQAFAPDAASDYRYLRLERLGARDVRFAAKLDRELDQVAAGLTSAQVAVADAWAGDAYARYFDGTPSDEVSNGANICEASDE
jgi:hypothetical protein